MKIGKMNELFSKKTFLVFFCLIVTSSLPEYAGGTPVRKVCGYRSIRFAAGVNCQWQSDFSSRRHRALCFPRRLKALQSEPDANHVNPPAHRRLIILNLDSECESLHFDNRPKRCSSGCEICFHQ